MLAGRAADAERRRGLSEETRQDLRASGIHRLYQPAAFGGAEAPFRTGVEILSLIGQGCGSTAWVLVQNITHNMMLAQWPARAQADVWGEDPAALLSGIFIPQIGKVRMVEGGYILSGRWPFVSGVNISDWALFSAAVERDGRLSERYFIVPRAQYEIVDTWHTVGLRGSSSNDVVLAEVFVPEHRSVDREALRGRPARHPGEALAFQVPLYSMFGTYISSAALGIAEAAVAVHREHTLRRIVRSTAGKASENMVQHVQLAEAEACVKSARLLLYGICDEATAILSAGRLPTMEERTRFRSEAAFAGQLSTRAVNVAWDAGGSGGVYDDHPISRHFRDTSVAARHLTQNWAVNAAAYGRVALGLPTDNPAL